MAAVAWEVLQTLGGYIVDHQLRHASDTYGVFAIVIGLLSWMYLGAMVTLLSAEVNVVHARKLWPRSFSLIGEQPLTTGDEDALRQRAGVEERRADEDVSVAFEPPRAKSLTERAPAITLHAARTLEWSDLVRSRERAGAHVHGDQRAQRALQHAARKDAERIHYRKVTGSSGREVPDDQIVKGYEVSDGEYVTLTDEEIAAAHVEGDKVIEIHDFVPLEEIDPIVFERTYYLGPAEGAERVYSLLARALASSGLVGIASFVFHDRDQLACLRDEGRRAAARAHVLRRRDPRRRRHPARPQARRSTSAS